MNLEGENIDDLGRLGQPKMLQQLNLSAKSRLLRG
jgi:hypothetical protein